MNSEFSLAQDGCRVISLNTNPWEHGSIFSERKSIFELFLDINEETSTYINEHSDID
jgi:hypothetical protein